MESQTLCGVIQFKNEVRSDQLLLLSIKLSCESSLNCCYGHLLNIIKDMGLGPNLSFTANFSPL